MTEQIQTLRIDRLGVPVGSKTPQCVDWIGRGQRAGARGVCDECGQPIERGAVIKAVGSRQVRACSAYCFAQNTRKRR